MDKTHLFALSEFIEILGDHVRDDDPDNFRAHVLESLSPHICFASAIWGEAHIQGSMTLHRPELVRLELDDLSDVQEAAYSDPHMMMVLNKPGIPISYTITANGPLPLVDFARKHDVWHVMSTAQFDAQLGLASGLVLTRNQSQDPFSDDDRTMMEAVFAHLIQAWTDNQIRYVKQKVDKNYQRLHFAAIGRSGRISGAEKGFISMLAREWPDYSGLELPGPMQLLLDSIRESYFVGDYIVVSIHRTQDLGLLVARERVAADSLTPKQLIVAQLCADGQTYLDIAKTLSIAPTTARNHIAAVHQRLRVHRNSEIARKLDELS